MPAKFKTP